MESIRDIDAGVVVMSAMVTGTTHMSDLMAMPWSRIEVDIAGAYSSATFLTCPVCAALVRTSHSNDGWKPKQQHIEWHLKNPDDAAILKKFCLQNQERERKSWQD